MRRLLAALVLVGALAEAPLALADCTCRGRDGAAVELGGYTCLNTAEGPRLARCEMVLNNSSWRTTEESCPVALFSPISRPLALGPAMGARVALATDTDQIALRLPAY